MSEQIQEERAFYILKNGLIKKDFVDAVSFVDGALPALFKVLCSFVEDENGPSPWSREQIRNLPPFTGTEMIQKFSEDKTKNFSDSLFLKLRDHGLIQSVDTDADGDFRNRKYLFSSVTRDFFDAVLFGDSMKTPGVLLANVRVLDEIVNGIDTLLSTADESLTSFFLLGNRYIDVRCTLLADLEEHHSACAKEANGFMIEREATLASGRAIGMSALFEKMEFFLNTYLVPVRALYDSVKKDVPQHIDVFRRGLERFSSEGKSDLENLFINLHRQALLLQSFIGTYGIRSENAFISFSDMTGAVAYERTLLFHKQALSLGIYEPVEGRTPVNRKPNFLAMPYGFGTDILRMVISDEYETSERNSSRKCLKEPPKNQFPFPPTKNYAPSVALLEEAAIEVIRSEPNGESNLVNMLVEKFEELGQKTKYGKYPGYVGKAVADTISVGFERFFALLVRDDELRRHVHFVKEPIIVYLGEEKGKRTSMVLEYTPVFMGAGKNGDEE